MPGPLPVNLTWLVITLGGEQDRRSGPPGPGPQAPGSPHAGPVTVDQEFGDGSLHVVRAVVAEAAAAAGFPQARVYHVVAAVHELAANAVRHGGGRGRLRVWASQDLLHCQVSDHGAAADGSGPGDPAAWPSAHGHGLWLVRQVADHVSIDRDPGGITVIASFTPSPDIASRPSRSSRDSG
ncbi:MAG TPA: ATP-binding protein [Streptosporangiaceae bacterium]